TPSEAEVIHEEKYGNVPSNNEIEDRGLRIVSDILNGALQWKKRQQWKFIQFLRGKIDADEFIRDQFGMVGPERVRRIFQILPVAARAAVLDSFLSSPRGLLPEVGPSSPMAREIIDHLLSGGSENAQ